MTNQTQKIKFLKLKATKNGHLIKTITTYIEAKETELKEQRDVSDNKRYNKLSKGKRITLKELSDYVDIIRRSSSSNGSKRL